MKQTVFWIAPSSGVPSLCPSGRSDGQSAVRMQMSAWRFTHVSGKRTVSICALLFHHSTTWYSLVENRVGFHPPAATGLVSFFFYVSLRPRKRDGLLGTGTEG